MATLFHGDFVSFMRYMDPMVGWEGQTKENKDKLLEHLLNNHEMCGRDED